MALLLCQGFSQVADPSKGFIRVRDEASDLASDVGHLMPIHQGEHHQQSCSFIAFPTCISAISHLLADIVELLHPLRGLLLIRSALSYECCIVHDESLFLESVF